MANENPYRISMIRFLQVFAFVSQTLFIVASIANHFASSLTQEEQGEINEIAVVLLKFILRQWWN
jgi:hypothetical protein